MAQTIELSDATRKHCLEVLRAGLRGDDFWPSIHAAEGLTLGGHGEEVVAYLAPRLPAEKDDQRRCGLARELVRASRREYAEVMLSILSGEETHGHIHAAESLFKVGELGDGAAMRAAAAQTDNSVLRLMAAAALAKGGSAKALQLLRESLGDAEQVRIAAWILGRVGDKTDVDRLEAARKSCTDPAVRVNLEHALAALGAEHGLAALAKNLRDEDGATRTYAATFAGDARAVAVAPRLKEMLADEHLDARIRAAQSLLVLASPPPPSPDDNTSIVYRATDANPRYTEGSVVQLNNGELLYAVTEFSGSGSDFAKAHLVAKRSSDGGATWSDSQEIQSNTGTMNVMSVTLRRMANGDLGMFYLQKNSESDLDLLLRRSQDEGVSFSDPVVVTDSDGYHVVNNDRMLRLSERSGKPGRWLAPAASTPDVRTNNHFKSHCFISDDDGRTWRAGKGEVDAKRRGAMEPEVIELLDGRVMMLVRTQLGIIGKAISDDGGDNWGPLSSLGPVAPEAPATCRRIPATGDLLLIWNNTFREGEGHGGKRTPLSASISSDDGKSWSPPKNLEGNPLRTYSYPSLIFTGGPLQRGRAVMSYWETDENNGRRISNRFRSLPVTWFYR
ncbi:MAG: exo-alpha-sialidase [Planctomycetales bacterium]|nr:exo-alpha-sialidase [Planctomycetales bacterium]